MVTKIKTHVLAVVLLLTCHCDMTMAQRHFYHRLDFGSSNIYTFVGSNLITGFANYLTHDMLFDNSYIYTFYSGSYMGEDIKTKPYNPIGLKGRDLLNDVLGGVKLGYQSDNMGNVNWGVYVSGHYKLNQVKAKFPTNLEYSKERFQYFKPGLGLLLTLGSVEKKTKVQIEGAIRYDVPIGYKGIYGTKSDELNNGVSSHYAVKVAGYSWISAGVYADINHYNLYKHLDDLGANSKFKMYNVGVTFTITPKRGEDLYD